MGSFSIKTCYWIARDVVLGSSISSSSICDPVLSLWKALWKATVPAGKVMIYMCTNSLQQSTTLYPQEENLAVRVTLFICSHSFETIGHLICECLTAKAIFSQPPFSLHLSTSVLLSLLISRNGCWSNCKHVLCLRISLPDY